MINPKYKNVFMAPDVPGVPKANDLDAPVAPKPLVVNGHTINSKLGAMFNDAPSRTIAETMRNNFHNNGQTIGSALQTPQDSGPGQTAPPTPILK